MAVKHTGAFIIIGLLIWSPMCGQTQLLPPDKVQESAISVFWENDVVLGTDYYYTNGTGIALESPFLRVRFLEIFRPFRPAGELTNYRFSITQKIYTPTNTHRIRPDYSDRPYAGILLAEYDVVSFSAQKKTTHTLQIGSLGKPSGSSATQNFIHDLIDNDLVSGWENQLGSDVLLNLKQSRHFLILHNAVFDLSGGYDLALGTMNAYTGGNLTLRLGKRKYKFGNSGPLLPSCKSNDWQSYLFTDFSSRLVFYDATLHGGLFNTDPLSHGLSYHETYRLVSGITTGFVAGYKNIAMKLSTHFLSPEIVGGRRHAWGSFSVRYTF